MQDALAVGCILGGIALVLLGTPIAGAVVIVIGLVLGCFEVVK